MDKPSPDPPLTLRCFRSCCPTFVGDVDYFWSFPIIFVLLHYSYSDQQYERTHPVYYRKGRLWTSSVNCIMEKKLLRILHAVKRSSYSLYSIKTWVFEQFLNRLTAKDELSHSQNLKRVSRQMLPCAGNPLPSIRLKSMKIPAV